jgi:copper chaperone CopZ
MRERLQRRIRIFGFEPDCGGDLLLDRVLRSIPGVMAARFDEPQQEACVEFLADTVSLDKIIAAIERTGFRVSESRATCPCC